MRNDKTSTIKNHFSAEGSNLLRDPRDFVDAE